MTLADAFRQVRDALQTTGIPFAIAGSWASTSHGEPRATNDIDLVAAIAPGNVTAFLDALGSGFYFDADAAKDAVTRRRSFNLIHQTLGYKFDIPVHDDHGEQELLRHEMILMPGLDDIPVPVVSAEDTILAKLRWYRDGGEVSDRQWRDILGVFITRAGHLDFDYLLRWATKLGVRDLYERARKAGQDLAS